MICYLRITYGILAGSPVLLLDLRRKSKGFEILLGLFMITYRFKHRKDNICFFPAKDFLSVKNAL